MPRPGRSVRVGIDVGGTFTDVVAIDTDTREVLGQLKLPTTHDSPEGVARGIVNAIERLVSELSLSPEDVSFIAHSTTQATNALLEGDVARVGVIGLGRGLEAWKTRRDTRVPSVMLAPGRSLRPAHHFINTGASIADPVIEGIIEQFRRAGVEVVVASEAFGVDDPTNECRLCEVARKTGLLATAGHDVSGLYGLRTRTRTAVLNAAILPKMIGTARMTEACVNRARITAPLMIMRSDGGVMSIAEVNRRPILTMLSGPAAGIAGALLHERVSDGIFIEVGGTSADISVIRDGQPQMRPARVGGHRTFLHTLDVRTIGIAGGSLIRENQGRIVDVGPRSAHIAGLGYASFAERGLFESARLVHMQPTEGDADDYLAVETAEGVRYALTPTCAANALGVVPEGMFARGDRGAAQAAFRHLAAALETSLEDAARQVLDLSSRKMVRQVQALIAEYHLDPATIDLVGGGGGAAALVPHVAALLGLPFRIARNAEVISTIGVALAMVRDTVERNIVDPSPEDLLRVRREATEAAVKAGAQPDTVEVQMEVDTRRNLVRAIAIGTTELRRDHAVAQVLSIEACRQAAARSMQVPSETVQLLTETSGLRVFGAVHRRRRRFRLFAATDHMVRVTDYSGVIRLQRRDAEAVSSRVGDVEHDLERVVTRLTGFGDAGRAIPDVHVLAGSRLINLSGLADCDQVVRLASAEVEAFSSSEPLVIVAAPRAA